MVFATDWLTRVRIKSAKISAFEKFNCVICFKICFLLTVENENFIALLLWHASPSLSILGWFLYFTVTFKILKEEHIYCNIIWHCVKSVQIRSFFWCVFSCFSPNTGKYGPIKTPSLDTFYTGLDFQITSNIWKESV